MNLTLHLVRSDLQRMRSWLPGWLIVLASAPLMGVWLLAQNPFALDPWTVRHLEAVIAIFNGVQAVIGYLLTIVLFHEHPIVGTGQFWLTRPISRGRMLGVKAIGALILVVLVPVVVNVPWWWWGGLTAGQIASAGFETAVVMVLVAILGAFMASLTDSFPRAALWTVLLAAVLSFGSFFFTVVNVATANSAERMSLGIARSVVAIAVVAIEMLAMVVARFFVRGRSWWLAAAGVFMMISIVAASQWPYPWVSAIPDERNAGRASMVTMEFAGARVPVDSAPGRRSPFQYVYAKVHVRGIPAGTTATAFLTDERWRWPDGMKLQRDDYIFAGTDPIVALGLRRPPTDPETRQWVMEHRKPHEWRLQEYPPGEFTQEISAKVPPSFVQRMRTQPPAFEGRIWWELWRPEIWFEVPLEPAGWMKRNGHGIRIAEVKREPRHLVATVVDTQPILIRSLLHAISTVPHLNPFQPYGPRAFLGIDRRRGEALDLPQNQGGAATINGVVIQWGTYTLSAPMLRRGGEFITTPDWDRSARIGIIGRSEGDETIFSRTVKVERFELPP